ncbi:hypothetical protein BpHYR1_048385 [Brachionus plicatilis]|uniref:Uncharacterized protein n=1 Tax=Brachionus plicatilis TaxID=10195 RepID=A0A3M7QFI8_BRAPC|nr:hypothetical protein BpHYR1_048385 [Brachionus plicatilis]
MKDEPNVLELRFWYCVKAVKWWGINGILLMGEISMGPCGIYTKILTLTAAFLVAAYLEKKWVKCMH